MLREQPAGQDGRLAAGDLVHVAGTENGLDGGDDDGLGLAVHAGLFERVDHVADRRIAELDPTERRDAHLLPKLGEDRREAARSIAAQLRAPQEPPQAAQARRVPRLHPRDRQPHLGRLPAGVDPKRLAKQPNGVVDPVHGQQQLHLPLPDGQPRDQVEFGPGRGGGDHAAAWVADGLGKRRSKAS